ncbi:hypothetical protein [Roseomonas elaeocarpi]|uniref:Lipoprotein n=1 Tax=Roseomonas elaeocarpi TaxID=907779 RepID=A0ABV6JXG3_9PROT
MKFVPLAGLAAAASLAACATPPATPAQVSAILAEAQPVSVTTGPSPRGTRSVSQGPGAFEAYAPPDGLPAVLAGLVRVRPTSAVTGGPAGGGPIGGGPAGSAATARGGQSGYYVDGGDTLAFVLLEPVVRFHRRPGAPQANARRDSYLAATRAQPGTRILSRFEAADPQQGLALACYDYLDASPEPLQIVICAAAVERRMVTLRLNVVAPPEAGRTDARNLMAGRAVRMTLALGESLRSPSGSPSGDPAVSRAAAP